MNSFSEAYAKAKEVAGKELFSFDWERFLRVETQVFKVLDGANGPDAARGGDLERLRKRVTTAARKEKIANVLFDAANRPCAGTVAARVATLKILRHLYYVHKRGGQTRGTGQNSGYLAAFDAATGRELWRLKVYNVTYRADLEAHKQEVYFTLITLDKPRHRLLVDNEKKSATPSHCPFAPCSGFSDPISGMLRCLSVAEVHSGLPLRGPDSGLDSKA